MPEDHLCPECQQGKHQNCDGLAWDFELDKLTHCDCEEGTHPLRGETEDDDMLEGVDDGERIEKWEGTSSRDARS